MSRPTRSWRGAGLSILLLALMSVGARGTAAAPVDVLALVASSGKDPDQVAITYAGPVGAEQAKQDLQTLAAALGRDPVNVRVSTKRVTEGAPEMTSVEAQLPEIVNRGEGTLPVQPFVDTFRRYSRLRLTFFVEPPFQLRSPAKNVDTGDARITVDNQGVVVNYDVALRHAEDTAGGAGLDGAGVRRRLVGVVLFLAALLVVGLGVAVVLLLRRSSRERASLG